MVAYVVSTQTESLTHEMLVEAAARIAAERAAESYGGREADLSEVKFQELSALRATHSILSLDQLDQKPGKTWADELEYRAAVLGHSRTMAAEKFIPLAKQTLRVPLAPADQLAALNHTSFPYGLAELELDQLWEQLTQVLDRVATYGTFVLTLYIAIKLRKKEIAANQPVPMIMINSGGGNITVGDIAINGVIDKRSGGFYGNFPELHGTTVIDPQDIESVQVQTERPTDGYFKPITLVRTNSASRDQSASSATRIIRGASSSWMGFPNCQQFLSADAVPEILRQLSQAASETDICRLLHLLGELKQQASLASDFIRTKLLTHTSEEVRLLAIDVLVDVSTQADGDTFESLKSIVQGPEPSSRVKAQAALALLEIAPEVSIPLVYNHLSMSIPALDEQLARLTREEHILSLIYEKVASGQSTLSPQVLNVWSLISSKWLVPLLARELKNSASEDHQIFMISSISRLLSMKRWAKEDSQHLADLLLQIVASGSTRAALSLVNHMASLLASNLLGEDAWAVGLQHSDPNVRLAVMTHMARNEFGWPTEEKRNQVRTYRQREKHRPVREKMTQYLWNTRAPIELKLDIWSYITATNLRFILFLASPFLIGGGFLYVATTNPAVVDTLVVSCIGIGAVASFLCLALIVIWPYLRKVLGLY